MTPPTVHSPARWALALLLAATCLLPAHAARLALVIGNKDYSASPLKNPLNDAEAMAAALGTGSGGLGFKVTLVRNLRRDDIGRTVEAFASTIRPGDDVVVFYAGHGLQVKGVNYLPAVDARIQVESDVALNSLNLNDLLQRLDEAKAGVRLLLIDACRDNPYSRGFRSSARGLARVEGAPSGTLMHFATRPGSVADDGKGSNGLYTSELLKHLRTPGLPVESMLKRVASGVRLASSGNQQPWTEGALDGEFYFASAPSAPPPVVAAPTPAPATAPPVAASPTTAAPAAGQVWKDCADCPELVALPTGRFTMGSPAGEAGREADEGPTRTVTISQRLAVGRYEVTRGQFVRFVQASGYRTDAEQDAGGSKGCAVWTGAKYEFVEGRSWRNPGFEQTDEHPVVCVSWSDAQAYLKWLNSQVPGKGYRLLSEAEWEYAARAGTSTRYFWGEDADAKAQCGHANGADATAKAKVAGASGWTVAGCDDGFAYTAPVGRFKPNAFGLHDMAGNALEWVQDIWHDNYSSAPSDGSAWMSGGDQTRRVLRGGSWFDDPQLLRSAYRHWFSPVIRGNYSGFRIARTY